MQHHFRNLPRLTKQSLAIALDVIAAWLTLWLAFSLRFDLFFWPVATTQKLMFVVAPLLAAPLFIHFGLYRAVIRYTGLFALQAIAKAVVIYGGAFFLLILLTRPEGVPRSIGLLQPLLYLIFIATSRALIRFWLNVESAASRRASTESFLIYGAGAAGIQIAHALNHARHYRIFGFIDDDNSLQGKTINGWRVYSPSELDKLMAQEHVQSVLLALPSVSKLRRLEIVESLRRKGLHIRSLPSLTDLASGAVSLGDIHELEVDDLLGRAAIAPNPVLMSQQIIHKIICVTGAGGSIGGELCRQILKQRPSHLLLLDHSEYNLYAIHQELLSKKEPASPTQIIPLLANVRDDTRLHAIFAAWKPHTVYHAAAYKHVPMVEHNVCEGIATNVLGTLQTAQAAIASGVQNFVLISTDKAVRPTNVMGASKRMAELVLQALASESQRTTFSMVRFGNVLDSSGSVVPLFRNQIKQGGPVTLTHPEVTRYFMTIPEAAQLVIQAAAMSQGGEVFVLDMGEPIKIADLARRMIELSGFTARDINPGEKPENPMEIAIEITGLRPGEKLYEELLIGNNPEPSEHPKIMKASESFIKWQELQTYLEHIRTDIAHNNVSSIRNILSQLVDGYVKESPSMDWVGNQTNS